MNIMGQCRPEHELLGRGAGRYPEIGRSPTRRDVEAAYRAARAAGLHRFDQRSAELGW